MHAVRRTSALLALLSLAAAAPGQVATPAAVASPDEHLARPLGVDFELADWAEVSGYFRRLGEESPHAVTQRVGTTTEGRDFLITIISSPENLADLDAIKRHAAVLADPRGRSDEERWAAVTEGKVVLFVSCAMHASECAGAQLGMAFAHRLATSNIEPWRSARDEIVTVLYVTNPDGVDHVTEWYRQTVGTPHEASGLLKLYQLYTGHDNNRDWFMLTQAETRIVTRLLYSEWFPQVYWDVHQQGSRRERFFVPPYRDPLNPNLDPAIITGIDALGSRALLDMTREGLTGISTGVSYDMWWNGGNRNVPVRHNIIGLLTEAASARFATPVFLPRSELSPPSGLGDYVPSNQFPAPWPGGWWRLRDIIDYEMAFGRSLLGSLLREGAFWRGNALAAADRAIRRGVEDAPRAWIIPSDDRDPAAVRRLVEALLLTGIEIHVSDLPLTVDGRTYPAGSIVIRRDQPYGAHVKDLFEVQRYPDGRPPYDLAGWTLPLLMGIHRVEAVEPVQVPIRRVTTAMAATASFTGDSRVGAAGALLSLRHGDAWSTIADELGAGNAITLLASGENEGLVVPGVRAEEGAVTVADLPRIGLYAPWSGSMSEGWMRYVLDTWRIPYVRVRNEMLRAGRLDDFLDVLIIPSIRGTQLDQGRAAGSVPTDYEGGLDPEGAVAIESFVRGGGTLITLGSSSRWAVELFRLPLVDVTREPGSESFSCPGSVLRGVPDAGDSLTADLPDSLALLYNSGSSAFRAMTDDEREAADLPAADEPQTLMRYAPTRLLLSGWIQSPETIENRAAWVRAPAGRGRVHLFAFSPHFRAWTGATIPLVFRAALLDRRAE